MHYIYDLDFYRAVSLFIYCLILKVFFLFFCQVYIANDMEFDIILF